MATENDQDTADFNLAAASKGQASRPASACVQVDLGALSHQGIVRPNNEDHFMVARFGRSLEPLLSNLPEACMPAPHTEVGYAMVLADGMGGAAGGEVASRAAIADLVQLALSTPDWIMRGQSPWLEEVMQRMAGRFHQLDQLLNERAAADPSLAGMGTTMTLACSLGLDVVLCHIGDSRAYLFRQGCLTQLTRDMTMAQELIDAGKLGSTQAAASRFRHVLTQCLGGPGMPKAEVRHLTLRDGDRLLLCSDGLYDMVADSLIGDELRIAATVQEACQTLVQRALEGGGKDNVTVVLALYRAAL